MSDVDVLKRVLMTQKAIAESTGYSQQAISLILNGDRVPSPERAIELEKATGACRESWLWPERHFNPYMPFTDAQMCLTCPNRINRVIKITEYVLNRLTEAEGQIAKYQVLKEFAEIVHSCNGFTLEQTVSMREINDRGAVIISHAGTFALPYMVTDCMMPWGMAKLRKGETIHVSYFPYDLPPEASKEIALGKGLGLRAFLAVSSGKHIVVFASMGGKLMEWSPEIIERAEWFVREVSRIYEEENPQVGGGPGGSGG